MILLIAIILGIVEGLTEFLPVSSTGHLIIVGQALNFTGAKASTFEVFIQLGAILAVVWMYRERFQHLLRFASSNATGGGSNQGQGLQGKRGLLLLGLTTLPALVGGALLYDVIKDRLFQPLTVAAGLAVGGVIIIIFEHFYSHASRRQTARRVGDLDHITGKQALYIGLAQLAAMWPGVSRSGATIIGGVMFGLDRKTAVEYSFLAAVPVMIAASSFDLLKNWAEGAIHANDAALFATGFITAFVAALLAVKYFVRFVQRYSFKPFGYYRIILAAVVVLTLGA